MVQPLFPLETYSFPVRTMAVRSMKLCDVVRYSLSSPTAARIVKEANIHLDGINIGCDNFDLESPKGGRYRVRFDEDLKSTSLETSDNVFENTLLTLSDDWDECLINEKNKQTIITRYFDHYMTVFSWSGKETVSIWSGESLPFIQSLFQLDNKRTVLRLYLSDNWSADEFRHVMNGLNVTGTVDLTGVIDYNRLPLEEVVTERIVLDGWGFPVERLSLLRSSKIEIQGGMEEQFPFIVNKWASGEAFQNLESLYLVASVEGYITYETLLENIETKEWDPKRRPGYRCEFNDDGVESFEDLRKSVDVFRPDGKFATISIEKDETDPESEIYDLHARVWKKEDLVWNAEEDKKKMREELEDQKKECAEEKERIEELERKIEELKRVKEELEESVETRTRKMDKIRDYLSKMSD